MGRPSPSAAIITPSCLRVERAIIFFISHSVRALMPVINIVVTAIISKVILNIGRVCRNSKNRISKNTPPVTRVDECTRADTGVGAAMAAGSQLENGT